ncbi:MAG: PLP-dependent aminotransferase family protein [Myxococcales bacterium]|nr:PLP-dependent aminotransferase family protein [Myxococcales bacterium]
MSRWPVQLVLDDAQDGAPRFIQISRAIQADIRRGRLVAGTPLPGSRTLASSLGVHRNTVLAAYRELSAEGWIATREARGTFVSDAIPEVKSRRSAGSARVDAMSERAGFDLPARGAERLAELMARGRAREGLMDLGGGIPDVRLVPAMELSRAVRRVLSRAGGASALAYGDPAGPAPLRDALAAMVTATRGLGATRAHVMVTRGSQMALDLFARLALGPGDVVAVEALGYVPAWEALRLTGARLVPIPVDGRGVDVTRLAEIAAREPRLRGVYVTPHHQYPTTVTMSASRRLALLDVARARRLFVLEDDYDHEFHYEGRPVLPLASADPHGVVVYVGTLSKVLAPALRVGFVVAPPPVIERLAALRRVVDRQGDHVLELALADLLDEGLLQRHIRRTRRVYAERRDALHALLEQELGGVLTCERPQGGTAVWGRVRRDVDVDAWAARARERGLVLQPGRMFAFDGKARPHLRLGFAQHDPREAREAVRRMVASLPAVSATSRGGSPRASRARRSTA